MRPALIVFAKAPVAGSVKTRLVPPLNPGQAAVLHEAFVRDTLESFQTLPDVSLELHTDIETDAWRDLHVPRSLQDEGDLGLKMLRALERALLSGAPQAAIAGGDVPTLPLAHIQCLLQTDADVAFGPTDDGGYYAIAARRTHPDMFAGVRWSTPHALDDTLVACQAAGLSTALGPSWFDIDSVADLERLTAARRLPPHTASALRHLTVGRGGKSE